MFSEDTIIIALAVTKIPFLKDKSKFYHMSGWPWVYKANYFPTLNFCYYVNWHTISYLLLFLLTFFMSLERKWELGIHNMGLTFWCQSSINVYEWFMRSSTTRNNQGEEQRWHLFFLWRRTLSFTYYSSSKYIIIIIEWIHWINFDTCFILYYTCFL